MATGDWYSDLLVLRHASPESILWHCYHIVKRSLTFVWRLHVWKMLTLNSSAVTASLNASCRLSLGALMIRWVAPTG